MVERLAKPPVTTRPPASWPRFWTPRLRAKRRGLKRPGAWHIRPRADPHTSGSFSATAPPGACGSGLRGSRTNESGGGSSRRKSPQRRSEWRKRSAAKTRLSRPGPFRPQLMSLRLRNRFNSVEWRRVLPPRSDSPASTRLCHPESASPSQPLRATRHHRSRLDARRRSVQPYLRHGTPMFPWRSLARIARELPASRHRGCDSPIHQARSKTTQRLGQGFAPESRSHLDARPPGPCWRSRSIRSPCHKDKAGPGCPRGRAVCSGRGKPRRSLRTSRQSGAGPFRGSPLVVSALTAVKRKSRG